VKADYYSSGRGGGERKKKGKRDCATLPKKRVLRERKKDDIEANPFFLAIPGEGKGRNCRLVTGPSFVKGKRRVAFKKGGGREGGFFSLVVKEKKKDKIGSIYFFLEGGTGGGKIGGVSGRRERGGVIPGTEKEKEKKRGKKSFACLLGVLSLRVTENRLKKGRVGYCVRSPETGKKRGKGD